MRDWLKLAGLVRSKESREGREITKGKKEPKIFTSNSLTNQNYNEEKDLEPHF